MRIKEKSQKLYYILLSWVMSYINYLKTLKFHEGFVSRKFFTVIVFKAYDSSV
jgi:hypothetical protein